MPRVISVLILCLMIFLWIAGNASGTLTHSCFENRVGPTVTLIYDANGNRQKRTEGGQTDVYSYDYENRLVSLNYLTGTSDTGNYAYAYDNRTRRVVRDESAVSGRHKTLLSFSGGTSVQEHTTTVTSSPAVEYIRGSDYGGGVGGILYTLRSGTASFNHYNSRGDVVAKTDAGGVLTYQAQYEAFGTRTDEDGTNPDRQSANTKDEDPTGLLNEGFRYRDLETGTFITRDPLGFVDGPNVYSYVVQNPWTAFDPKGLSAGSQVMDGLTYLSNASFGESYQAIADVTGLAQAGAGLRNLVTGNVSWAQLAQATGVTGAVRLLSGDVSGGEFATAAGVDHVGAGWNRLRSEGLSAGVLNDASEALPSAVLKGAAVTGVGATAAKVSGLGKFAATEAAAEVNAVNKATSGTAPVQTAVGTSVAAKTIKQRNKPPDPLPEAEGRPHTIIEKPGPEGQYTTHNGDGTWKQYRGSGQEHGGIPRPNVKETEILTRPSDGATFPSNPKVRPAQSDEVPGGG